MSNKGATVTNSSSVPDRCALALLQGHAAASSTNQATTGLISTYGSSKKIGFIHGKRGEPPLPKVSSPVLPKVDHAAVAAVGFTDAKT